MIDNGLFDNVYNPDVLSCLANLSNDEVFTPPEVVNQILDMLPQELFENPDTTFLDPACKTGVFLREIAKRLIKGLEWQIPDLQERLDHIFHKQLFGIAITELTSLLSRRGLYCSKYPNSEFSVSHFDSPEGHIRFRNIRHVWVNGKCRFCGTSQNTVLGQEGRGKTLEAHAYEWIHTLKPEEIFNMRFDVILGNPPYQLSTAGDSNGGQAKPIYQLFVQQAMKLKPRFITMITPSRWFSGGWGLDDFRSRMLFDNHIRELHDFQRSEDCFSGVEIKGGVSYFLWDRDYSGNCRVVSHSGNDATYSDRCLVEDGMDTFIRWNEAVSIYHKVSSMKENTVSSIVSAQKPFDLPTNAVGHDEYRAGDLILVSRGGKRSYYPRTSVLKNKDAIDQYKVFISKAYNGGDAFPHQIIGKPIIGEPGTCCTETYIYAGTFNSKSEAEHFCSYVRTKFFRFMVLIKKISQDALQKVYSIVPMQDYSSEWTDERLYKKYQLSEEEVAFIDSMIKPMDLGGDDNG